MAAFYPLPRCLFYTVGRFHPPNHEPTEEEWRTLARQANEERDPYKLLELAQQIVEKYDEETRRKRSIF
jgi:hypothetical protein